MSDTIDILKKLALQVRNATQEGENTAERVGRVLVGILENLGVADLDKLSDIFIRKDIPDSTRNLLSLLGGVLIEKLARFGEFITGVSGGMIDENGDLEMRSGYFRKRLFVPELAYNRITYFKGRAVLSPGGGCKVKSYVKNEDGSYTVTPDLTDADGVSQFKDDILSAFFTTKNEEGKLTGFAQMQFRVTEADYSAKTFKMVNKPGENYEPGEEMILAQTGNFSDEERQTYILFDTVNGNNCITFFDKANTWDPEPAQMPAWFGKKKGMKIAGIDCDNYSAVLQNILITGLIFQIDEITGDSVRVPIDKGEWIEDTNYGYYDRVSHNGALWLCVSEKATKEEPGTGNAWLKQVSEGAQGEPGMSVVGGGHWESSKTPYQANTLVSFYNCVFISNKETSNPPIAIARYKDGSFIRQKNGGYILAGKSADFTVHPDWTMLLDGRELQGKSITFLGRFDTAPSNPAEGNSYYNTTDKCTYIYQNGVWMLMVSDGKDGRDYEYIYTRNNSIGIIPDKPDSQQVDDYVPSGWTDDFLGVSETFQVEWGCKRTKRDGVWSEWSEPAIVHRWSKDGENAVIADLDNEMVNCALTSDGKVSEAQSWVTNVAIWYGYESLPLESISTTQPSGITVSANKDTGAVTVSVAENVALTETNDVIITLTASKNGQNFERQLTFTIAGVRAGADGSDGADAVLYSLVPSVSSVAKYKDGTYSASTVSCKRQKAVGDSIADTTDGELKYSRDGGVETNYTDGTAIATTSFTRSIKFLFYVGGKLVDVETIPMLSDGHDGQDGENAVIADLDNEMVNCALTSEGKVSKAQSWTTNVTMWYGYEELELTALTATQPSGLTVQADKQAGTVTVSASAGAALAETSNVVITLTASKNGQNFERKLTFTVAGVRAGADGIGVSSITNYYLATSQSSGVTTSTSGWTTTMQSVSASKKYLWNYEKIAYTDGQSASTTPAILGMYSADGADGKGIASVTEEYGVSTSQYVQPSSWQSTPPKMSATNKYLWNRETTKYTDNTSKTTVHVIAVYGDKGDAGEDAILYSLVPSVSSVAKYKDGTCSVASVSCTRQKTVGATISETTDGELKYSLDGGAEQTANNGQTISTSTFKKSVKFLFYVGGKLVDVETIPMLSDGHDGQDGSSIEAVGHWEASQVPYAVNKLVNFGRGTFVALQETSEPPLPIARFKDGTYMRKKDGGYILAGKFADMQVNADWQMMSWSDEAETLYWLNCPISSFSLTSTGSASPSSVEVTCKQSKSGNVSSCADLWLAARRYNGSWVAHVNAIKAPSIGVSAVSGYTQYSVRAYRNQSDANAWNENYVTEKGIAVSEQGIQGINGAFPYDRGVYKSGNSYVWNQNRRDKVICLIDGVYYNFLVKNYGATVTAKPSSAGGDSNWEAMQKYDSIVTDTFFADGANIAGLMFKLQGYTSSGIPYGEIRSQNSGGNGTPMLYMNTLTGYFHCANADISGTITSTSGNIGGLVIQSGGIFSKNNAYDGGKFSNSKFFLHASGTDSPFLGFSDNGRWAGIGLDCMPSTSNISAIGRFTSNYNAGVGLANAALYIEASGTESSDSSVTSGSHAIYIPHGNICGFRLRARRVNASTTLSNMDSNILVVKKDITITLPSSNIEDAQEYRIRNHTDGNITVNGKISSLGYPTSEVTNVTLNAGKLMFLLYDKVNNVWLANYADKW